MSTKPDPCALVIAASSDIGTALCQRWLGRGWRVGGTFRTPSPGVEDLRARGALLVSCDLTDTASVEVSCAVLAQACPAWDVLVLAPGTQEPVGPFMSCAFDAWEASLRVNLTAQLRVVHALLESRRRGSVLGPCVLFFAGGGTNNATTSYSAYTLSKIALIKMCELLDAELPDTRFVILGPGWVKTKIHNATLRAGTLAGENLARTQATLASGTCTPMERVLDACDWIVEAPRDVVGGRNFSVVFDAWGTEALAQQLRGDPHMYKLRRHGNAWHPTEHQP